MNGFRPGMIRCGSPSTNATQAPHTMASAKHVKLACANRLRLLVEVVTMPTLLRDPIPGRDRGQPAGFALHCAIGAHVVVWVVGLPAR